jgi:hypothetical protein
VGEPSPAPRLATAGGRGCLLRKGSPPSWALQCAYLGEGSTSPKG